MYPIGHPTVLQCEEIVNNGPQFSVDDAKNIFGLVRCTVIPPRDLLVPVLPLRGEIKKLYFTLCAKCAAENSQDNCSSQ